MELTEKLETINAQLVNQFGVDTVTGRPMWRVVWSEDQYEKRMVYTTPEGLTLLTPIVKEVPKYGGWIKERYVLERLVYVPDFQQKELAQQMLSYEPMWTFEDAHRNYLPPSFRASKFVIDTVYAAQGKQSMAKYKDPDAEFPQERLNERVDKLYSELFGNETEVTDALSQGRGVVVPNSYDNQKES